MKRDDISDSEKLRSTKSALKPDPRSIGFVRLDRATGRMQPLGLEDHYQAVCDLKTNSAVPADILVQYETAKNLYLYAWFVYRFFSVAEHQALAALELGLRTRFLDNLPRKYGTSDGRTTLGLLLRYARDCGFVQPEGFRSWHENAKIRAQHRYAEEKSEEMSESKGTDPIERGSSSVG